MQLFGLLQILQDRSFLLPGAPPQPPHPAPILSPPLSRVAFPKKEKEKKNTQPGGMDDLGAENLQMGRLYPGDSSINHHIFIIK